MYTLERNMDCTASLGALHDRVRDCVDEVIEVLLELRVGIEIRGIKRRAPLLLEEVQSHMHTHLPPEAIYG